MELDREHRAAVPWRLPLFQAESLSLHSSMFIWKFWLLPLHGEDHLYSSPSTLPLGCQTHHWPCVIPECYSCTPGSRVSEEWDRPCMLISSQITPQFYPVTCPQATQALAPLCFEAVEMRTGLTSTPVTPSNPAQATLWTSASPASTVQYKCSISHFSCHLG